MKKPIFAVLCLLLLSILIQPVSAQELETDAYARKMLEFYQHYQTDAQPEVDYYLDLMAAENPEQAEKWENIMARWRWADSEMPVSIGTLPEGLPQDDSLCIVVLGYGLLENGYMKQELVDRLEVALASAQQYPNAWVLVTGGETSSVPGLSEAGAMRSWLVNHGVSVSRVIMEPNAMSTTENAENSCRILTEYYPQVSTIALVSSDYHCRWGSSLMGVAAWLSAGDALRVEVAACCETTKTDYDSYRTQAQGIASLAGIRWENASAPELFVDRTPKPTEPETEPVPTVKETEPTPPLVPVQEDTLLRDHVSVGLAAVVLVAVMILWKKRKPLN